jgi:hypothetical protein
VIRSGRRRLAHGIGEEKPACQDASGCPTNPYLALPDLQEKFMNSRTLKTLSLAAAALVAFASPAMAAGFIESQEVLAKVRPGTTNAKELEALLGAPLRRYTLRASGHQAWEWEALEFSKRVTISITIGTDGIVRDLQRIRLDVGA